MNNNTLKIMITIILIVRTECCWQCCHHH